MAEKVSGYLDQEGHFHPLKEMAELSDARMTLENALHGAQVRAEKVFELIEAFSDLFERYIDARAAANKTRKRPANDGEAEEKLSSV